MKHKDIFIGRLPLRTEWNYIVGNNLNETYLTFNALKKCNEHNDNESDKEKLLSLLLDDKTYPVLDFLNSANIEYAFLIKHSIISRHAVDQNLDVSIFKVHVVLKSVGAVAYKLWK